MKNLLILIGRGKSTLIDFILDQNNFIVLNGLHDLQRKSEEIIKNKKQKYICALECDDNYIKVEQKLRRRAIKFYLNF